jgi:hypothetical protein
VPYLQVDLDAKKQIPRVARAAGLEVAVVGWGLLELWEHAWNKKTDTVGAMALAGCFGPSDRIAEALVEHGFLEPVEDGYRVRGADKYLRISAARSRGARSTNERRKTTAPVSLVPRMSDAQATQERRSEGALTPSTEHRAPSTEKDHQRVRVEKPTGFLADQVDAEFRKARQGTPYALTPKDELAVSELLRFASGDADEILRRWRIGLRHKFVCNSLVGLARNWNDYAQHAPVETKAAPRGDRPRL